MAQCISLIVALPKDRTGTVCWRFYPTFSEGWGRVGTPRRPNCRATPQGLDHRSRIEREELKVDLRRGSDRMSLERLHQEGWNQHQFNTIALTIEIPLILLAVLSHLPRTLEKASLF